MGARDFRHSFIIFANIMVALFLIISFSKNISADKQKPSAVLGNQTQASFIEPSYSDNLLQSTANLVNSERASNGANQLSMSPELNKVAEKRAQSMQKNVYYAHVQPDGTDFSDILVSQNISYDLACENLNTLEVADSANYVKTWLASKDGHRECLLGEKYTKAGYALADINFGSQNNGSQKVIVAIYSN